MSITQYCIPTSRLAARCLVYRGLGALSAQLRGSYFCPGLPKQKRTRELCKKHALFVARAFLWRSLCVQGVSSRTPDPSWEQRPSGELHRNTQHTSGLPSISRTHPASHRGHKAWRAWTRAHESGCCQPTQKPYVRGVQQVGLVVRTIRQTCNCQDRIPMQKGNLGSRKPGRTVPPPL